MILHIHEENSIASTIHRKSVNNSPIEIRWLLFTGKTQKHKQRKTRAQKSQSLEIRDCLDFTLEVTVGSHNIEIAMWPFKSNFQRLVWSQNYLLMGLFSSCS